MLAGGGLLAGIGFTMALFIGDLALPDTLIDSAKLGILSASVVCAVAGLAALAWLTRKSA
jgi:NhaA family Na+:H+ antiporter